jgi:RNA polymerase sigma factor (TIGR02999 family)
MPSNAELLADVYRELRNLAAARIAAERPGITLDATGLVHEAYLRLGHDQSFEGRAHFYAAAAEAMRRILVEAARRRNAIKRGGDAKRVELDDRIMLPDDEMEILALHDALDRLHAADPQKAELVKLRYFAGLTSDAAADVLGISASTADRQWRFARAWLKREMSAE